ncbi:MAG TPA: lytic transglycosylase domain-containing protein [Candidatus Acidoferrum sp.]|nr:lytic transglycosylase domain-containing protein [Candidatus Acidoferrum sp.]
MRITQGILVLVGLASLPVSARADYLVLRNGARMNVSSYELRGDRYRVQIDGGWAEIAAANVVAIEPEEIFVAAPKMPLTQAPFGELIRKSAEKYGVDVDLVFSVVAAESNFNPKAVSRRNARGLMQLLPETAKRLGVRDIYDPAQNIDGGTRYLRDLLKLYEGDLALALAAYNAGPGAVQRYGRIPPYNETIAYVRAIRKTYALRKSGNDKSSPSATATGH